MGELGSSVILPGAAADVLLPGALCRWTLPKTRRRTLPVEHYRRSAPPPPFARPCLGRRGGEGGGEGGGGKGREVEKEVGCSALNPGPRAYTRRRKSRESLERGVVVRASRAEAV